MSYGKMSAAEEAQALLPWYVNGTLEAEEQEAVEELLSQSEEARQELTLLRAISTHVKSEPLPAASELGLRRLRRVIETEARSPRREWWKPTLAAAAAAIIAVQSGLLLTNREDPLADTRLLSESPVVISGEYWLVQVQFADQSDWQDVAGLIAQAEATVVDGPSALGLLRLAVDRNNALFSNSADLLNWFEQQPQVIHIALEEE